MSNQYKKTQTACNQKSQPIDHDAPRIALGKIASLKKTPPLLRAMGFQTFKSLTGASQHGD
jgi:hypothetical protein